MRAPDKDGNWSSWKHPDIVHGIRSPAALLPRFNPSDAEISDTSPSRHTWIKYCHKNFNLKLIGKK